MIPPKDKWTKFSDAEAKLAFMLEHKLVAPSTTYPKSLIYSGGYRKEAVTCTLEGYETDSVCVIRIDDELHCINTDYLSSMQTGFTSAGAPEAYIVLDLETTGKNHKIDKIIEIAAVKYQHGFEQDVFETLVNPQCTISPAITALTGISPQDLQEAPIMDDVLPALKDFLGDLPIVAHNAPFDMSFLSDAYSIMGYKLSNERIDTVKLSQKAFPDLKSHRLEDLKILLNMQSQPSHRALSDVYTTAALFEECNAQLLKAQIAKNAGNACETEQENIEKKDLFESEQKCSENASTNQSKTRPHSNNVKVKDIQPTVEVINKNGPLYGKKIVFTGELQISRSQAMQLAVNCGAILKSSVSSVTDFLVVGTQDKSLVGEDGLSTKEERALELNNTGKGHVVFLNEDQFLEMTKADACPNEQLSVFEEIENIQVEELIQQSLERVLQRNGLAGLKIKFEDIKKGASPCYSVKFNESVIARFYDGKQKKYLEIPKAVAGSDTEKDFTKIYLNTLQDIRTHIDKIECSLQFILDNYPKDFSCCSRYMECSDACICVHPDKTAAIGCYYRKVLSSGRVFYGKNRNIE